MSLTVNTNMYVDNNFHFEYSQITYDPIERFPSEIILEIFSHLNLNVATLGTFCLVSKSWKQFVNHCGLWKSTIYRELAFGNDKWARCFGDEALKEEDRKKEWDSLPWQSLITDCQKFKALFPEKNAKDTLMLVRIPKTLHGGLTLNSFGKLTRGHFLNRDTRLFADSGTGYRYIDPTIAEMLGDKLIDKSRWVLMTKDILPDSRKKSYTEQREMVANLVEKSLIGYEVPTTLESAVCILSQYLDSKIRLFHDNPSTNTRCKDTGPYCQTVVGGFSTNGLGIASSDSAIDFIGIAVLRKFEDC